MGFTATGSGPPVVLGHGVGLDESIFDALRERLDIRWSTFTWNTPGHGRRPLANGPLTHEAMADEVAAMLRRAGIERAVVGGVSQGGWLGLHLALRHPDLVAGLVLISCTASPHPPAAVDPVRAAVETWRKDGCPPEYATWQAELSFGRGHEAVARWADYWMYADGARFARAYELMLQRLDLVPSLHGIDAPALVIRGGLDQWVPGEEVEEMVGSLTKASYQTIPEAWHVPTVTHPDEIGRLMDDFLRQVWK